MLADGNSVRAYLLQHYCVANNQLNMILRKYQDVITRATQTNRETDDLCIFIAKQENLESK